MKKRVAAYCRVSTDNKDQKNSFDNQKSYFDRIINSNPDYQFVEIYADRGLSGTKLFRPEFDRMLQDAGLKRVVDEYTGQAVDTYIITDKKPKFDFLYVKDISRFARNVSADNLLKTLKINKVYVVYVTFDGVIHSTETSDGIPFMQGHLQAAEQFSRELSSKVRFGRREGSENKKIYVGSQIYGYNYIPLPDNRLEIIPHEAKTVKLIYELYLDGYGTERISKELDKRGIMTQKGKRFTTGTLLNILKNEKYTGWNDGQKLHTGELFGDRRLQRKSKEEQIRFETDKIPQIIDVETYNRAQEIRQSHISHINKRGQYSGKTDYAGLVICGQCGAGYKSSGTEYRKRSKKFVRYYACNHKYRYDEKNGIPKCDNPTITQEALDELITSEEYFYERAASVEYGLHRLIDLKNTLLSQIDKDNEAQIKELNKQLNDIAIKLGKIIDLLLDEKIDKSILEQRQSPLLQQKVDLENKIKVLSKTNTEIYNDINTINKYIAVFEEEYSELKADIANGIVNQKYERKTLLRDISKITVWFDKDLEIEYKSTEAINEFIEKYDIYRETKNIETSHTE